MDVDKLDFLIRDSQKCYIKYGDSVDVDRLLRNLTVVVTCGKDSKIGFDIGAYEKGQTAAESLTFARYLLYQSVYWHHTARAIRAMLSAAVALALQPQKKKGDGFVIKLQELLGLNGEVKTVTPEIILDFVSSRTTEGGKQLVELIKQRNYYKRILTVHYEGEAGEVKKQFLHEFRDASKKKGFDKVLQDSIKKTYENFLLHTGQPKISLLSPEITERTLQLLSDEPNQILCDVPRPSFGAEDEMLQFIPEPERLQKNYYTRQEAGARVSEVWQQVHFRLMQIAAKGRVFCNPSIRDSIMAALGPEGVRESLKKAIQKV